MDIEALIPHRGRMKLIDDVVAIDAETATTSALVSASWPLCRGTFVDPIVLIELVAQTAAVHISWKKGYGRAGRGRGWIVGIKQADFYREEIPVGSKLLTKVRSLCQIDNYTVLEGEVRAGTETLGRVQIQVFRSSSDENTIC